VLQGAPPDGRPLIQTAGNGWRFRSAEELRDRLAGDCVPDLAAPQADSSRWWIWLVAGLALLALVWLLTRRMRTRTA